jgi:hypothetical protein
VRITREQQVPSSIPVAQDQSILNRLSRVTALIDPDATMRARQTQHLKVDFQRLLKMETFPPSTLD